MRNCKNIGNVSGKIDNIYQEQYLSGKIDKYECLTGKEILPSGEIRSRKKITRCYYESKRKATHLK